ncbi:hypothetical protein FSARC_4645 [Fusarium sarcochroum]|uniref:AAA+ ATPase domain-containing protein n=1 Tax=Fusarium sarcochroum TaxID=1208366 RepID=A0A8H4XAD5_9HYPO|nr:hypothetical protein FSARC_4645 [Fusarium sarcochroum]
MPPKGTLDILSTTAVVDGYWPLIDPDLSWDTHEKHFRAGRHHGELTKANIDLVLSVHATISRDQTEQQKAIQEKLAVRNVLEKSLGLPLPQSGSQAPAEGEPEPESISQFLQSSPFKPSEAEVTKKQLALQGGGIDDVKNPSPPADVKARKKRPLTEVNLESLGVPQPRCESRASTEYTSDDQGGDGLPVDNSRNSVGAAESDFARRLEAISETDNYGGGWTSYHIDLYIDSAIKHHNQPKYRPIFPVSSPPLVKESSDHSTESRVTIRGDHSPISSDSWDITSEFISSEELSSSGMSDSSDASRQDHTTTAYISFDTMSSSPYSPAKPPSKAPLMDAARRQMETRARAGTKDQVRFAKPRTSPRLSTSVGLADNYKSYRAYSRHPLPTLQSSSRATAPGSARIRPTIPLHSRTTSSSVRNSQASPSPAKRSTIAKIQDLSVELEELKRQVGYDERYEYESLSSTQNEDVVPWKCIYRIDGQSFLGVPMWTHGRKNDIVLAGTEPLRDIPSHFEHHPQVQFCIFKDFAADRYLEKDQPNKADDNDLRPPSVSSGAILLAPDAVNPMEELAVMYPDFQLIFPDFDFSQEISAPYFVFFHMFPTWKERAAFLHEPERWVVLILYEYLDDTIFRDYRDALGHFETGKAFYHHIHYLMKPGEIVITKHPKPTAFMISTRATSLGRHSNRRRAFDDTNGGGSIERPTMACNEPRTYRHRWHVRDLGKKEEDEMWTMKAWNWDCAKGVFARKREILQLLFNTHDLGQFDIDNLDWFPLRYASGQIKELLYNRVDIEVDHIREVDWNKTAFENLTVDDTTKYLIKALISTQQLKTENSTDLISGKGNGLVMLLHGGPGTGKTLTAGRFFFCSFIVSHKANIFPESVAEYVEKPLYGVTCGDIGTKPEDVEKYLETVLTLGKTWGCVVLLDEADVFLEERSLQNLERKGLVSVFLRVLEYYDGILILTSNRVGTFDQAFKSRIQLSLHYEKLSREQRVKIWTSFFKRLQDLGEKDVDSSDLYAHVNEFAEHDMNGCEIRNTMTTARQLAQFDSKVFTHEQIQQVVEVAGKFENYLKNDLYTEDI